MGVLGRTSGGWWPLEPYRPTMAAFVAEIDASRNDVANPATMMPLPHGWNFDLCKNQALIEPNESDCRSYKIPLVNFRHRARRRKRNSSAFYGQGRRKASLRLWRYDRRSGSQLGLCSSKCHRFQSCLKQDIRIHFLGRPSPRSARVGG